MALSRPTLDPEVSATLERLRARSRELADVAVLLTSTFDLHQILSNLMDVTLRAAGAEVGSLWLCEEGGLRTRITWGLEEDLANQLTLGDGESLAARVVRTGELFWAPRGCEDDRFRAVPAGVSIDTLLGIPLRHRGHAIGCVLIVNAPDEVVDEISQETLEALAGLATVAIENARLHQVALEKKALERELSIARQVQLALLPARNPEGMGIRWASCYFPMGKVGGDYYDFVPGPDGRLGVVVADVSDKGVPAALFMVATRNLVRRGGATLTDPAAVVREVNLALCEDTERYASMFVTLFYGQYEPKRREFRYGNAGHCPPLLLTQGEDPRWLTAPGGVLGQFPEMEYVTGSVSLSPGDLLVFYTDGVTEATSPEHRLFGREGLARMVSAHRDLPVEDLVPLLVEELRAHCAPCGFSDDLTLLVGRVE